MQSRYEFSYLSIKGAFEELQTLESSRNCNNFHNSLTSKNCFLKKYVYCLRVHVHVRVNVGLFECLNWFEYLNWFFVSLLCCMLLLYVFTCIHIPCTPYIIICYNIPTSMFTFIQRNSFYILCFWHYKFCSLQTLFPEI